MSNVTIFPAVRHGPRGRWWYGGRGFKTKDALQASLTPSARKCIAPWEYYRFGAPLTFVDVPPPQRRDGGGGNAA